MDETPETNAESGGDGQEPAASAQAQRADSESESGERFGPLELQRLRKEDGRALIVYSRAERKGLSARA